MTYTIVVVLIVIAAFFAGYFIVSKVYEYFRKRPINNFAEDRHHNQDHGNFSPFEKEKHYAEILGLRGNITKNEIRKSYNNLVMKYHPDRVQHLGEEFKVMSEKKFKEINEAYLFFKKKYNL